jgi:hypothetical protein
MTCGLHSALTGIAFIDPKWLICKIEIHSGCLTLTASVCSACISWFSYRSSIVHSILVHINWGTHMTLLTISRIQNFISSEHMTSSTFPFCLLTFSISFKFIMVLFNYRLMCHVHNGFWALRIKLRLHLFTLNKLSWLSSSFQIIMWLIVRVT